MSNLVAAIRGPDPKGIFTAAITNGGERTWHRIFADSKQELQLRLRQNHIVLNPAAAGISLK